MTGVSKQVVIMIVNKITTRLKTTGATAGIPKFPNEFNTPIQSELIKISHRYGSIILNKIVVNCNLYEYSINPGAIILIITGAKKIPKSIIKVPASVRKQKKEKKRGAALALPSFTRIFEKMGINEIFKIPSENNLRARSKGLKAIKNASLWEDTPK